MQDTERRRIGFKKQRFGAGVDKQVSQNMAGGIEKRRMAVATGGKVHDIV